MDGREQRHRLFVWGALCQTGLQACREMCKEKLSDAGDLFQPLTRLSTPLFGFSVFIFSLSTAPRPWPLRSSRLWGCLHMNSRGSGFTKRTIFGQGRLSRKISHVRHALDWEQAGFTRICVWRLAQMSSPFYLYLCLAGQKEKCALFKSNMETIGNCQPCNCGFKACSL